MTAGLFDALGLGSGEEGAHGVRIPPEVVCRQVDEVLTRVAPFRQLDRFAKRLPQPHHE